VYELSTLEAIGATVEDAISRGLEALNVTRDRVTIVVLDPGGKAAPGQRPREARVQLTLNEPEPRPEPESPAVRPQLTRDAPAVQPKSAPDAPTVSNEEVMRLAQQTLRELLDRLQVKASVTAHWAEAADEQDKEDGPPLVLDIRGDDLGVLIGRRGETLSSLQYITRLIVSQKVSGNVNLVVDVESYKARREQQLRQLAQRMAERVASTRKPIALEPMPPSERRIIHLTLRDHPVVTTESVGRDEDRKVTIILKSRRRA
jgi:spoIIIJ-associated protein